MSRTLFSVGLVTLIICLPENPQGVVFFPFGNDTPFRKQVIGTHGHTMKYTKQIIQAGNKQMQEIFPECAKYSHEVKQTKQAGGTARNMDVHTE